MGVQNLFRAETRDASPLDASSGREPAREVSNFLTIQSLMNFGAMTGAIFAAWNALQNVFPWASAIWVPHVFAAAWLVVSLMMSWNGFKKDGKLDWGTVAGAVFVGLINSLVLAGAVVGMSAVV